MIPLLTLVAQYGRWILIAGLIAGLAFPGLAAFLQSYLPEMVAALLFIAALRIGHKSALGSLNDMRSSILMILHLQLALPLAVLSIFHLFDFSGPIALAIILMASGATIAGSANLVLLTGNNPAPALRLLIVGTALLPLTVIPIFFALPQLGSATTVLISAGRLLVLIAGATIAAFMLRQMAFPNPNERTLKAIDGLSAIVMAIIVIGLMAAVGPAFTQDWPTATLTLLAACAANFGLQAAAAWLCTITGNIENRASIAIVAGNRNMALFLTSLPFSVMEPLLLFIGCYQVPMYLTPLVWSFFKRR